MIHSKGSPGTSELLCTKRRQPHCTLSSSQCPPQYGELTFALALFFCAPPHTEITSPAMLLDQPGPESAPEAFCGLVVRICHCFVWDVGLFFFVDWHLRNRQVVGRTLADRPESSDLAQDFGGGGGVWGAVVKQTPPLFFRHGHDCIFGIFRCWAQRIFATCSGHVAGR